MRAFLGFSILCLSLTLTPFAQATDHEQNCKNEGQKQSNQCQAAGKGAEGANTGQASGIGNSMPGKQINVGAQGQKQSAIDSANKLNAANQQCEQNKKQCSNKCDSEAAQADADAAKAQAQDPMHQCNAQCMNYKKQAANIRSRTKNEACIAPIMAMQKELGDGANNAQQAANKAGDTQGQSGGMPPIPPIPPPSSKPSPPVTPTPISAPTADLMSPCADPSSATLASCTKTLLDKCTPGLAANATTDPTCDTFTMRYCNTLPSTGNTQFAGTNVPQQGQSREGAGVGSSYCNTAIAKNFCEDPGRSQCATCQNYRNQFSDACKVNPASCAPTQFSSSCPTTEPPIATTPPSGTSPVAGVGGGSTGGGGGGDLMAGSPPKDDRYSSASVAKEGQSQAAKMDMAVSEGGGSGGAADSSGEDDDFASKFRKKSDLAMAANGGGSPASSRSPASVDIGRNTGPSLFSISSTTIQNMCARERLHHCGNLN